jgi:hypothetical protein
MNIYCHDFISACPNNGKPIFYELEIRTHAVIMVEEIIAACAVPKIYHEALADKLTAQFGGMQLLRAFHHGVRIETVRGTL